MSKSKGVLIATGLALVIIAMLALVVYKNQTRQPAPPAQESATEVNLGITYLTLTPGLAAYYGLEVDSGALVTEVSHGSPAHRAGVEVGDVILTFNGTRLDGEVPLLGMMRACISGHVITMEVFRGHGLETVTMVHTGE